MSLYVITAVIAILPACECARFPISRDFYATFASLQCQIFSAPPSSGIAHMKLVRGDERDCEISDSICSYLELTYFSPICAPSLFVIVQQMCEHY